MSGTAARVADATGNWVDRVYLSVDGSLTADSVPLAILATRLTMRHGLADRVKAATEHELEEQKRLRATEDFKEGGVSVENLTGLVCDVDPALQVSREVRKRRRITQLTQCTV